MESAPLADINLLKAIVAAAGGSIVMSNEIYQQYLSMDLDSMSLEFESEGDTTKMVLQYQAYEEDYSV